MALEVEKLPTHEMYESLLGQPDVYRAMAAECFGIPLDEVTLMQRSSIKFKYLEVIYGIDKSIDNGLRDE